MLGHKNRTSLTAEQAARRIAKENDKNRAIRLFPTSGFREKDASPVVFIQFLK
jgi:hypothetical protein